MTWRRLEALVQWLPAGSWWQRHEAPAQQTRPASGGQRVQVIDAAADPAAARSYFAGMAAGS